MEKIHFTGVLMQFGIVAGDGGCLRQTNKARPKAEAAFKPLPDSDPVSQSLEGEGCQELRDEVISSGSLYFRALDVPKDPCQAGKALTQEMAAEDGGTAQAIECSEKPFSPAALTKTARLIAGEVNDYTDTGGEETKRIQGTLSDVLASLELNRTNGKVITARTEVSQDDESRHLTTTLFYNTDSHKAIAILTCEGHM